MTLLTSTSALVGPDIKVSVRATYSEPLNIFAVSLAYPGAGKSQAYKLGLDIPHDQEHILVEDFTRKGILAHLESHSTALLAYEEMSAFFEQVFQRQSLGQAERAFFCRAYEGGIMRQTVSDNQGRVRRITVDKTHVVIGGFQTPDSFVEHYVQMLAMQDGFADRLLLTSPRPHLLLPASGQLIRS